jgi:hypothetical protein
VLGAVALGAIASQAGDDCYLARQPVTDHWGHVVYFRDATVCD